MYTSKFIYYLYTCILNNPQVVNFVISNWLLTINQWYNILIKSPKLLPQITIKELHNDLLKPKDERSCSYARDKNSSVIISDTTHIKLLPSNLSNINNRYQSMCGCEIFIYVSMVHTEFNACGL